VGVEKYKIDLTPQPPSLPLPNPLLRGEGSGKTFVAGRGSQSLSLIRGEVWREVLYLIVPSYLQN
jgi:hypothetical protein